MSQRTLECFIVGSASQPSSGSGSTSSTSTGRHAIGRRCDAPNTRDRGGDISSSDESDGGSEVINDKHGAELVDSDNETEHTTGSQASANKDKSHSQPPTKKRKLTAHTFKPKWSKTYTWITYDKEAQRMFCRWCQSAGVESNWTNAGIKSCRKNILEEHNTNPAVLHIHKSFRHKEQLKAIQMDEQKRLQTNPLRGAQRHSIEGENMDHYVEIREPPRYSLYQSLQCVFKSIYWICQKELPPFTTFRDLKSLLIGFQVPFADALKEEYDSNQTIEEMILAISHTLKRQLLNEVQASSFYALLLDETTDISVRKECCFAVKYLSKTGTKTSYLSMQVIENGTANCIANAAKDVVEGDKTELGWSRLIALGTDGCSAMVGRLNGVVTQLKESNAHMINVHCSNHRVALACVDAAKEVSFIEKKFKPLLVKLYFYYHHSANRSTALESFQKELNLPVVTLKKAADTRWLSTEASCQALRKAYPAVLKQLSEDDDDDAQGLFNAVRNTLFFRTLLMLCDLLPVLNRLQLQLQTQNVDFSYVALSVDTAIVELRRLRNTEGHYEQKRLSLLTREEYSLVTSTGRTRGERYTDEEYNDKIRIPFIDNICDSLTRRFDRMDLFTAFSTLFNVQEYPDLDSDDLEAYGVEAIETLYEKYGPRVNLRRLKAQWSVFKETMKVLESNSKTNWPTRKTMDYVIANFQDNDESWCSELSKLARIASVIPMSTSDVERYFSALNRVKTVERNRLKGMMLDALLRIALAGPPIQEFDFHAAMSTWYKGAGRVKTNRRIKIPELS